MDYFSNNCCKEPSSPPTKTSTNQYCQACYNCYMTQSNPQPAGGYYPSPIMLDVYQTQPTVFLLYSIYLRYALLT